MRLLINAALITTLCLLSACGGGGGTLLAPILIIVPDYGLALGPLLCTTARHLIRDSDVNAS